MLLHGASVCSGYSATEFRRHREVTNPVHVMGFLTQWKMYLDELPHDPTAKNFKKLDHTVFEKVKLRMYFVALTIHILGSFFRCLQSSWDNYSSSCMRQKMFGNPLMKMDLTWNMTNRDGSCSNTLGLATEIQGKSNRDNILSETAYGEMAARGCELSFMPRVDLISRVNHKAIRVLNPSVTASTMSQAAVSP